MFQVIIKYLVNKEEEGYRFYQVLYDTIYSLGTKCYLLFAYARMRA